MAESSSPTARRSFLKKRRGEAFPGLAPAMARLLVVPLALFGFSLNAADPELAAIERRLGEIVRHERVGIPVAAAGWIFHLHNPGTASFDRLVVRRDWREAPRDLVDPERLADRPGIGGFAPAPDGATVAVTLTHPGAVRRAAAIWRTGDGQRLADHLTDVVGDDLVWSMDAAGFFYVAVAASGRGVELRYHRVGEDQAKDVVVFTGSGQEPFDRLRASLTTDGRELLVEHSQAGNLGNGVAHVPLGSGRSPAFGRAPRTLIPATGDRWEFVGNDGDMLLFSTNAGAPRGKVVALDLRAPATQRGIVHEAIDWGHIIEEVRFFAGSIVVRVLNNVTNRLYVYDFTGRMTGEIALPDSLPVRMVGGSAERPEVWILAESLVHPGILYRHDLRSGRTESVHERKASLDPATVRTRRFSYPTVAGPEIVLFTTRTEKVVAGPQAPWWLFGVGGFGEVLHRRFSPLAVLWLERGGVLAHASYRGGGEYGTGSHLGGVGERRVNSFQDCVSAVRFLAQNRMADPARLVVSGAGIGATTVAGALALAPELATGVVLDGGFYRLGGEFPPGAPVDWAVEFGEPASGLPAVAPALAAVRTARPPSVLVGFNPDDALVPAAEVDAFVASLRAARAADASAVAVVPTPAANPGAGRGVAGQDDRIRWLARQAHHALAAVAAGRKEAGPAR